MNPKPTSALGMLVEDFVSPLSANGKVDTIRIQQLFGVHK